MPQLHTEHDGCLPVSVAHAGTEPIDVGGWLKLLNAMCICERRLMAVRIVDAERPGKILDAADALAWAALVLAVEQGLDPSADADRPAVDFLVEGCAA